MKRLSPDGDGDLDACIPTYGIPYFVENQGGHLYPAPAQPPAGGRNNHTFVDIDGDGDLDLVSSSPGTLLLNQGGWTFVNATATAFPVAPGSYLAVIDADSDGDADILSETSLWWNNGAGSFTQQTVTGSFVPGNLGAVAAIADYDGDGDLDFAGRPNFLRQVAAATAPVRGAGYAVDFHTAPGTTTGVIALAALGGSGPNPFGTFGNLRLDIATAVVLSIQSVSASPMTLTYPIPAAASLVGVQLHYQALMTDPRLGTRFTNAIGDTLQ